MKNVRLVLSAVGVVLLTGCASTPVALAPVGPGPMEHAGIGSRGQLLVYSAWQGHFEGNNPTYYQHADYYIYNSRGKMIHHVYNAVGHYDPAPRLVPLPVGKYLVQSRAIDFGNLLVTVPVVIEPGETTRVRGQQLENSRGHFLRGTGQHTQRASRRLAGRLRCEPDAGIGRSLRTLRLFNSTFMVR